MAGATCLQVVPPFIPLYSQGHPLRLMILSSVILSSSSARKSIPQQRRAASEETKS